MKSKEEFEAEIENKAKVYWNSVFRGEREDGDTYLDKLTNRAIKLLINLYKKSKDQERLDLSFQLMQNSFVKDNKIFTKIYIGGTLEVIIDSERLGEINEFLQKSKTSS